MVGALPLTEKKLDDDNDDNDNDDYDRLIKISRNSKKFLFFKLCNKRLN